MPNILLDTDIGDDIDDALALAFAVQRPELDVKAVTTVWGRMDLRFQMAAKLLRILGREDIPVAPGWTLPLRPVPLKERRAVKARIPNQAPFVKEGEEVPLPEVDAADLIIETVNRYPRDIAICTIGPLTNVAVALQRDSTLPDKVQWIAMMGGEVAENRAEYNIASDPHAAEIVFSCGAPLFLGTLSVTRRVVMTPPYIEALSREGTPLTDALSEMIALWMPHRGNKPGPVLYDLSPVLWSFDRGVHTTEQQEVHAITQEGPAFGMTVPGGRDPNMEVTVDMKGEEVLALFMDTVRSTE